jgi:actin-like ATPase involved in cell morphogenesis
MTYHLGIDLGTTYTCAAAHEGGRVEVVSLGERGPSIPSVLFLREEGDLLAGDSAERNAVSAPERVAREFKRRLGDPTPMMLGGAAARAEVLTGNLMRWVFETVVRAKGGPPETLALTHPANWGTYKLDLFATSAEVAGLNRVTMVTEPQAAAVSYASEERVEPGAVVAVYDLGGGTFDAAVLRKEADGGFTLLGTPDGIERLGGIDFDAAVFAHVSHTLEGVIEDLDPDDEAAVAAVARLRQECTQAKEALSSDTEATIPVLLPNTQADVRITREQFEEMIRPTLAETVTAMERAMRSAQLSGDDIDHVLLVGGSSRIPLVGQLVSAGLGRPVAIDAHPKHAIALGAAHVAARASGVATADAHTRSTQAVGGGEALPAPPAGVMAPPASDPLAGSRPAPPTPSPGRSVFDTPAASPAGGYAGMGAVAAPDPGFDPDATIAFHGITSPAGPPPAAPPPGQPRPERPAPPVGPPSTSSAPPQPAAPPAPPGGPASRPAPPPAPPGQSGQPGSSGGARHLPPPPAGPPPGRPAPGGYAQQGYPQQGYPQQGGYAPRGTPPGYRPPPGQGPTTGWQGSYADPTFDAAGREAPPPSLGYQAAGSPPPPGQSHDLPPGLLTPEQRAARQASEQRKAKVNTIIGVVVLVLVMAAAVAAVLL